jgi:alpha-L-fucosidase 2
MMSLNFWVAHPFWWRFLYTQDEKALAGRGYPIMKECARFYGAYLTRAADGKFDIWPTAAWDVYLSPYLKENKNCHMDLAFIRTLMKACVTASELLGVDAEERATWRNIVANLREFPTAKTPDGDVFAPFEGTGPNTYLYPTSTMGIFPGDEIGLHSPAQEREIAWRTAQRDKYQGAGEQLLKAMAKIRLGSNELDSYESITRQTTLSNMCWIIHGWDRNTWVHQSGFPILINESILQSYTGQLRVAPVRLGQAVYFGQLRTVGAFLVSGQLRANNRVAYLAIKSEAGKRCQIIHPGAADESVRVRSLSGLKSVKILSNEGVISFETKKGETYIVDSPSDPWEEQRQITIGEPSPLTGSR